MAEILGTRSGKGCLVRQVDASVIPEKGFWFDCRVEQSVIGYFHQELISK